MKNAGITLIVVAGLVVGILAYNALKPDPLRPPTVAEVKLEADALRAEAAKEHPGMAQSDAMKAVSERRTREALNKGDAEYRAKTAASVFFGAYFMNTRARPAYCRKRGVDLSAFVSAYDETHRAELDRARAIFLKAGLTPESLLPAVDSEFQKMVDQDMKDFASGAGVPLESVCPLFNENAKMIAQAIELPPEVRQALFAAY
jgi:hypothetical protein